MYNFLIMYDSYITEEEERMIELALEEATELFPNLNLILMKPDENERLPMGDAAVEKARVNKKGAINAIDTLRLISKGAEGNYAILFTSKELYLDWTADIGLTREPGEYKVMNVVSENAILSSLLDLRALELDDSMYLMEHFVSNSIGQLVYGLEQNCKEEKCMMHTIGSDEEMIRLARKEEHAKGRLCKKCREKFLSKMPLHERSMPSHLEIV